jgi:hypothetical protein
MTIKEKPVFTLEKKLFSRTNFKNQLLSHLLLKCHHYPEGIDCIYLLKVLLWSKLLTVIVIREKVSKFGNA